MPRRKNPNGPGRGWRKGQGEGGDKNKGKGRGGDKEKGQNSEEVEGMIENILNAPSSMDEDGLWITASDEEISAASIFEGDLSLTELVAIRPYKMDDLGGGTIQFRVSDKVYRAAQRLKERSGSVYDIMSDMHRDIYVLGLLILSERHEGAFGTDMIISATKAISQLRKDTHSAAEYFSEALKEMEGYDQRVKFLSFLQSVKKRSSRVQRYYLEAIQEIPLLAELYARLQVGGEEEEAEGE